jgi:hypothetical protein
MHSDLQLLVYNGELHNLYWADTLVKLTIMMYYLHFFIKAVSFSLQNARSSSSSSSDDESSSIEKKE